MGKTFNLDNYLTTKAELFASANDFAKWAVENHLVDIDKVRYRAIREYYKALPHKDRRVARIETADYFCLSVDRVETILYNPTKY